MKEIIAYKTLDGKKFVEKQDAVYHEKHLKVDEIREELLDRAREDFKEELKQDHDGEYYFNEEVPVYWEESEDLGDFVKFAVDTVIAFDGRVLKFMNYVAERVFKELK